MLRTAQCHTPRAEHGGALDARCSKHDASVRREGEQWCDNEHGAITSAMVGVVVVVAAPSLPPPRLPLRHPQPSRDLSDPSAVTRLQLRTQPKPLLLQRHAFAAIPSAYPCYVPIRRRIAPFRALSLSPSLSLSSHSGTRSSKHAP